MTAVQRELTSATSTTDHFQRRAIGVLAAVGHQQFVMTADLPHHVKQVTPGAGQVGLHLEATVAAQVFIDREYLEAVTGEKHRGVVEGQIAQGRITVELPEAVVQLHVQTAIARRLQAAVTRQQTVRGGELELAVALHIRQVQGIDLAACCSHLQCAAWRSQQGTGVCTEQLAVRQSDLPQAARLGLDQPTRAAQTAAGQLQLPNGARRARTRELRSAAVEIADRTVTGTDPRVVVDDQRRRLRPDGQHLSALQIDTAAAPYSGRRRTGTFAEQLPITHLDARIARGTHRVSHVASAMNGAALVENHMTVVLRPDAGAGAGVGQHAAMR